MIAGIVASGRFLAAAPPAGAHWLATLGSANTERTIGIGSAAVLPDGSLVIAGEADNAGVVTPFAAKYNVSGDVQWQRVLASPFTARWRAVTQDAAGAIYCIGDGATAASGGTNFGVIAKYSQDGTLVWQRKVSSSNNVYLFGVAASSAGVAVVGYEAAGGGGIRGIVLLIGVDGVLQWQRALDGAGTDIFYGCAFDGQGDVYVSGYTGSTGGSSVEVLVAKFSGAGSMLWQRYMGGSITDAAFAIKYSDQAGALYLAGYCDSNGTGAAGGYVAKIDTNGSLLWQRKLSGNNLTYLYDLAVRDGGVIVAGHTTHPTSGLAASGLAASYAHDGSLSWVRSLSGASNEYIRGVKITGSDFYLSGYTESAGAGGADFLSARLPLDGSKTGSYGALSYQPLGLTSASIALSTGTITLSNIDPALTVSANTFTANSLSLTNNRITL